MAIREAGLVRKRRWVYDILVFNVSFALPWGDNCKILKPMEVAHGFDEYLFRFTAL